MAAKLSKEELEELTELKDTMIKSNDITNSSSQMLLFNVEDILGIAQMRVNKFIKNCQEFDIIKAVQEVVSIQAEKAKQIGVNLACSLRIKNEPDFNHNEERVMVTSDKKRL